jgi:selenocysteine lyase/cysteine desulfurase
MSLDLTALRRQFPTLDGEWTFLDNAGGSQILGRAVEILRASNRPPDEGVRALSRWLHCDPSELVLGRSTTELLAGLASSMMLAGGDEIVVTDLDHDSNFACWQRLQERGAVVKTWKVDRESLTLRLEDLSPLLSSRTRLVCFTHASNLTGTVHPVAELTRAVHDAGARVCVDGVAYAPHRSIDVRAWDVDYYVVSVYKLYGPRLAALYRKRELVGGELPPDFTGELQHALPAVVEYLESLAFAEIAAHEARLSARLLGFLSDQPGVHILGERGAGPSRLPTISFVVDGQPSAEIVRALARRRIAIQHGEFHARRFLDALGLAPGGVVRVSMVPYNTLEEVDRLIAAFEDGVLAWARATSV